MVKKKVYLLITIDTECDKDPNWEIPKPISFRNIALQKSLLEPIFKKYNIKATYLLSPEVLMDDSSVQILKTIENVEFGTHLHEEFIGPNANFEANRTKNIQANLSYEVEKEKLENLTQLFNTKFGYLPKSFRSGRFGSSTYTTNILLDLGYKVDSSVTPFKTLYFDNGKKINHWGIKLEPYYVIKINNKDKLLQIPLTLINRDFEKLPSFVLSHLESKTTVFKKVLKKFGFTSKTEWLRPYRASSLEMINISDYVIKNHFREKQYAILNIMFHSNEILVNGSPYCKNSEEVRDFLDSLNDLFLHLNNNYTLCSTGLEGLYDSYAQL
ncbi:MULTISPECIES: polysaccharide deacetylase family protein [Bizionia]|uniref:NodB homology domain-containing protein n=1 Tax=Bizionia algoritergicola TaxID=291187 RepID=A0A5D0QRW7_9FLAO|nr:MULTISPECIES: hypothetical protein [Bizionia]OBX23254.1 hypothetical protein BAA08_05525 [Bizionia sp. APA-3]TYB71626.1 hypothetical protein ES675_13820 [Bizionia algoritergicola]